MLTYTTLNCFSENIRLAYLPKPKCESGTTCLDEGVVWGGPCGPALSDSRKPQKSPIGCSEW